MAASVEQFVRPRWQAWLGAALDELGLGPNEFARALVRPNATDGDIPRGLVKKWLDSEVTVTAELAYRTGQTLLSQHLEPASGLVGVLAAGHFVDFVKTLRQLGTSQRGHELARPVAQYMPLVAEHAVAQAQGWRRVAHDRQSFMNHARHTVALIGDAAPLEDAWSKRNLERLHYASRPLKKAAPLIDLSIHIATAKGLPRHFAWLESSGYVDIWHRAADFYLRDDEFPYHFLERGDGDLREIIAESARRYAPDSALGPNAHPKDNAKL